MIALGSLIPLLFKNWVIKSSSSLDLGSSWESELGSSSSGISTVLVGSNSVGSLPVSNSSSNSGSKSM